MVSAIFWEVSYRWRLLRDYPESECCVAVSVHVEVFAWCGEGERPRYHRVPILGSWQDAASHVSTANTKALNSRSGGWGFISSVVISLSGRPGKRWGGGRIQGNSSPLCFPHWKMCNQNLFLAGICKFQPLLMPAKEQLEISRCILPMLKTY